MTPALSILDAARGSEGRGERNDMRAKHEKTEMEYVGRTPTKSKPTSHFRSGFNVWLRVVKCPVCGALRAPLANLHHEGKHYFCTGVERSNYWKEGAPASSRTGREGEEDKGAVK